jgi:MoaA/NifB/PqqE/SkfB family radical SAM enzyme
MNVLKYPQMDRILRHIYINVLEKCNLRCKMCYTRKTSPILSKDEILRFVKKYQKAHILETVTFCGGEVFSLSYFPTLVNHLTKEGLIVQIITNGTIDKLDQISSPNAVNLIVSLDGLKDYHDANRGAGNFEKSISFLQKAQTLGFHFELFSIVTRQNFEHIDEFETMLHKTFNKLVPITYHPRKPLAYLTSHPFSNIDTKEAGFDFLTNEQMLTLFKTKKTFPPRGLGCFQIALSSNGNIYGCCEGTTPIGTIDDDTVKLIHALTQTVQKGCAYPGFMCGMKQYLKQYEKTN